VNLASLIVTPAGYATSTSSDVHNGPISTSQLDKLAGRKGASSSLGFVSGYEVTYDSTSSNDYVDVSLATLGSPSAAANFLTIAVAGDLIGNTEGLVRQTYEPIPDAVELDGTKLGSDGTLEHVVVASKGSTFMWFDYVTDHTGPPPADLGTWVGTQYGRL
jgi:hypothetical protein